MTAPADVWVTRARPGADSTADRLRARGLRPLVAPLLGVRPLLWTPDLDGVGALAFTSLNAVAAAPAGLAASGLPVFAVGDATADAARRAGFARVESASGDAADLARLVASRRAAFAGDLLHLSAAEPASDLGALLAPAVRVRPAHVYETVALPAADAAHAAWPHLRAVLLHSPKAAAVFAATAGDWPGDHVRLLCLSPAVARRLEPTRRPVLVAERPDEPSLLNLLDVTGPGGDGTNIA